jgi:phenylacetate-CoA ligase
LPGVRTRGALRSGGATGRLGDFFTLCRIYRRHADRDSLVAFQNRRLQALVAHACARVPHYRELFTRHGVGPDDIRTVADLRRLPVTSRHDLQQDAARVVAQGTEPSSLITRTTSGSSGVPLAIRRTWIETRLLQAVRARAMHEQGMRLTDRIASVARVAPPHQNDPQRQVRLLRALGMYRHRVVDCLATPREILDTLAAYRADIVGGFGGVVARIAEQATDDDRRRIRPRLVIVGGDTLTPLMRRHIAEAFGAPVLELYTSVECTVLASECRETGDLHLADDGVIVEVMNGEEPAREGERGEVVVTNLHAFAMPFIRYRLGDIVTKGSESCRCGKPYGTIRAVQGRMNDYFILPDGRAVHPFEIVYSLIAETVGWMRAYRLIQERTDLVALLTVPRVAPSAADLENVRRLASGVLGSGVRFEIRLVNDLELERTGKFRVSRSMVHSAYDAMAWNQEAGRG